MIGERTLGQSLHWDAMALAAPAALGLFLLVIGPTLGVIALALTDWQFGQQSARFVGLDNFAEMLGDRTFRTSLINTAIYVAVVVPSVCILGFIIATVIEAHRGLRALYRSIHLLPVMATLSAMAIAWEALLHPTIGPINAALSSMGFGRPNWLGDADLVVPTLCLVGIWQHLGYAMILFIAGLKAIPSDLYDAADVDGIQSALDRAFRVTLPMLGPVTMFVIIVVALKAFEVFDTVRVLTQGGPGDASEMLLHTLYVESFEFFRTGYGSALTVVFLITIIVLTLTKAWILDRRVHYT